MIEVNLPYLNDSYEYLGFTPYYFIFLTDTFSKRIKRLAVLLGILFLCNAASCKKSQQSGPTSADVAMRLTWIQSHFLITTCHREKRILAHASKFVRPGSVRLGSNITDNLHNVAFRTPTGKKVLIVINDSNENKSFEIKWGGKTVTTALDGGAVGTYVW